MVSLSRELGVDLIGEGVESPEEHEWLVRLGVPLAQGYWYARPEDVGDVADRGSLASWSSANHAVLARARGVLASRPRPFALGG
ncbi:EAL domain-containing protein [Arsenicicoccus piscis]|uniref:EAL domain-containing protein n=1 Tax=Arsenicicoccus piscis TaxID=673954 RepID=A0ABQ6HQI6_9MICO|nr:EAL domain-containing protein [Arsenicicoccus piscis]GMA20726.1 hypothetical protein GCM10025862_27470 [Arsenicicoccus piscis]